MAQSKPAKKNWTDLTIKPGDMGREDCQEGWQLMVYNLFPPQDYTILDVGAGLGKSKERLGPHRTITQDPCPDTLVDIHLPVEEIKDNSYNVVTAFDVIEHVEEDIDFLNHLKRIAKKFVFITTPNYNISKAANGCHCREYTPQEFLELTKGCGRSLWIGNGVGYEVAGISDEWFASHTRPHQAVMLDVRQTNLGRWDKWYKHRGTNKGEKPTAYGKTEAYSLGAEWLKNCKSVADLGCGLGYLRHYLPPEIYHGIDGSKSPFSDTVADLVEWRGSFEGVFMRGVIEHDRRWKKILDNALDAFTKRMVLVLFTPINLEATKEIAFNEELGVPDISFSLQDLQVYLRREDIKGHRTQSIKSDTTYGEETIFYLEK